MKSLIFIVAMIIATVTISVVAEDVQPDVSKETPMSENNAKEPELTEEQKRYLDMINSPEYALQIPASKENRYQLIDNVDVPKTRKRIVEEAYLETQSYWKLENAVDIRSPWDHWNPEMPDDVPEVAKFFEIIKLTVDKYNEDKLGDMLPYLDSQWESAKGDFKKKYKLLAKTPIIIHYERENKESSFDSFLITKFDFSGDVPPNSLAFIPQNMVGLQIRKGELESATILHPPISEDYVCVFRRLENGSQFCSFIFDHPFDKDRYQGEETPWIIWNDEGKIIQRTTKKLFFYDYDVLLPHVIVREPAIQKSMPPKPTSAQ